jgi:type IV fimbrial biogenesis protein FimT
MHSQRGFTLIELLVTIAITAVVAAYAIPSYIAFINRQTVQSEANAFAMDLRFARSEAARANESVLICGSADGTTCSGDWNGKRIVFVDGGTQGAVDGADKISKMSDAPSAAISISADGFSSPGMLRFRATGQPESAITVVFCTGSSNARAGKKVSLSTVGRPTITSASCS